MCSPKTEQEYFDPSLFAIERILDIHGKEGDAIDMQFYVKWLNSPYSSSTWESEKDLLLNNVEYKEHLASFETRTIKPTEEDMLQRLEESNTQEHKLQNSKECQNELMSKLFKNGGQLRGYQAEGVSWMLSNHINNQGSILADEMGLGYVLT